MSEVFEPSKERTQINEFKQELTTLNEKVLDVKVKRTEQRGTNKVLLKMIGGDSGRASAAATKVDQVTFTLEREAPEKYNSILSNYFQGKQQVLNAYLLTIMLQETDLKPRAGEQTGETSSYFQLHQKSKSKKIVNDWGLSGLEDSDTVGALKIMDDTKRLTDILINGYGYQRKLSLSSAERRQIILGCYSKEGIILNAIKSIIKPSGTITLKDILNKLESNAGKKAQPSSNRFHLSINRIDTKGLSGAQLDNALAYNYITATGVISEKLLSQVA